ncbi:MAG: hypothetical protein JO237_11905 [Pseudolabrys sp.]|nr:hypothetical protein [Pseudolabrys sp.]
MRELVCVSCQCELERVEIAGGRAVVICLECRQTGDEQDFMTGGQLFSMPQEPRRPATPPRSASRPGFGKRLVAR